MQSLLITSGQWPCCMTSTQYPACAQHWETVNLQFKEENGGLLHSGLIWTELNMTLSDRRMNSLLNKSPESGYIHSRNGASESQHLCTMKEEMFKKISVTEDTNQKAARTRTLVRWERGCSAPSMGTAARELSQRSSTMRWAPRPCQNLILISWTRITWESAILSPQGLT